MGAKFTVFIVFNLLIFIYSPLNNVSKTRIQEVLTRLLFFFLNDCSKLFFSVLESCDTSCSHLFTSLVDITWFGS